MLSRKRKRCGTGLQAWADTAGDALRDPTLKPVKLHELDARGNQIWRVLFRIADLAGRGWPERARDAAVELSGGDRRHQDASVGVKLLGHIRQVFDGDRMFCGSLVVALNEIEDGPYGGWNDGKGISTRELGKKIGPYGVLAKVIRIGESRTKGYERGQFVGPWDRYLAGNPLSNSDTVTTGLQSQKTVNANGDNEQLVTVSETGANPHEYSDVTVVTVSAHEVGSVTPGEGVVTDERRARWRTTAGQHLRDAEVLRLLETYRPEVLGRDDLVTTAEQRELAALSLLHKRASAGDEGQVAA